MSPTDQSTMPAPSRIERDSDGRIIGLGFDGKATSKDPGENPWLVAIDGSKHSLRATAEALHQAGDLQESSLHLLNVQPWLSKEAAEDEFASRGWAATAQARALIDASRHSWQLHLAMGDAAEHIVALADNLGCRGIAIGSSGLGVTRSLLLGSVAYKVIHMSSLPLLLVR